MNLVTILCVFLILVDLAQMQKLETLSGIAEKNAAEDRWGFLGKKRKSRLGKDKDGKRCINRSFDCEFDCTCCSGKCITIRFRGQRVSSCAKTEA